MKFFRSSVMYRTSISRAVMSSAAMPLTVASYWRPRYTSDTHALHSTCSTSAVMPTALSCSASTSPVSTCCL